MKHMNKPEDMILCTGRVMHKNYNESTKRLFVVIGIFTPKNMLSRGASMETEDRFNRDFPAFIMDGKKAKEAFDSFEVGDHISIRGHVNTEEVMRPVGNRTYRREWRTLLVADEIHTDGSHNGYCNVLLGGEIIRVWKNPDQGHSLYVITVKMTLDNGEVRRASFVYFDRNMEMEPKVGDFVTTEGIIQTKRIPAEDGQRAVNLLSIVSRFLVIDRK